MQPNQQTIQSKISLNALKKPDQIYMLGLYLEVALVHVFCIIDEYRTKKITVGTGIPIGGYHDLHHTVSVAEESFRIAKILLEKNQISFVQALSLIAATSGHDAIQDGKIVPKECQVDGVRWITQVLRRKIGPNERASSDAISEKFRNLESIVSQNGDIQLVDYELIERLIMATEPSFKIVTIGEKEYPCITQPILDKMAKALERHRIIDLDNQESTGFTVGRFENKMNAEFRQYVLTYIICRADLWSNLLDYPTDILKESWAPLLREEWRDWRIIGIANGSLDPRKLDSQIMKQLASYILDSIKFQESFVITQKERMKNLTAILPTETRSALGIDTAKDSNQCNIGLVAAREGIAKIQELYDEVVLGNKDSFVKMLKIAGYIKS